MLHKHQDPDVVVVVVAPQHVGTGVTKVDNVITVLLLQVQLAAPTSPDNLASAPGVGAKCSKYLFHSGLPEPAFKAAKPSCWICAAKAASVNTRPTTCSTFCACAFFVAIVFPFNLADPS
jgi:hypothetical protein